MQGWLDLFSGWGREPRDEGGKKGGAETRTKGSYDVKTWVYP